MISIYQLIQIYKEANMRIDYGLNYIKNRCGIGDQSISLILNNVLKDSDNHFKFIDSTGNVITFDVIDVKLFKEYRDILFNNAPLFQHERDVQSWINSVRYSYLGI